MRLAEKTAPSRVFLIVIYYKEKSSGLQTGSVDIIIIKLEVRPYVHIYG